jgi:hypothetical protein
MRGNAAKSSLADELERIQSSPIDQDTHSDDKAQDEQLTGLDKIDEALKRMGIPLVDSYRRPLSSRTRRPK